MPKPVILAADDSVTVRKLIEISLKDVEVDLHFAIEGKECLSKALELKPSLILLDYILPDMKGIDICHALLERTETREIPVLLISGNGAAIRQTYENAGNVADYLTKPFAPNVLSAVVSHLLAKAGRSKAIESESLSLLPQPTTQGNNLEPVPERLRASVIRSIVSALQAPMMAIPGLEAAREDESPSDYFLDFLTSSGAVDRLCQVLVSIPELKPAPALLRCSSDLTPVDRVLHYLDETRATGRLSLVLADETIQLQLEAGEIVSITSNNPKLYCAGAAFPFRTLDHAVIGAAVAEQQRTSAPFFVTVQKLNALPAGTNLEALLQAQGASSLVRAVRSAGVTMTLDAQPSQWRGYRQRYSLPSLLLAAYRAIDDWLTIETAIPSFDAIFQRASETSYRPGELKLDAFESEALSMMDGAHTVQELIEWSRLRPFDLCRRIFPLVRLGLVVAVKSATNAIRRPSGLAGSNVRLFANS